MITHQLTNEDVAALLGAMAKVVLKDAVPMRDGCRYRWEINFTVRGDSMIIDQNSLCRKKIDE